MKIKLNICNILVYIYRHSYSQNQVAAVQMRQKYNDDLMGKVCLEIFHHHHDNEITYKLDEEATKLYESIFDKYISQFNMKYSGNNDLNQLLLTYKTLVHFVMI